MSNWVEYWDKDKELVTIIGSYVPREGDWVQLKLKSKYKVRKVLQVIHQINKEEERFKVILQ